MPGRIIHLSTGRRRSTLLERWLTSPSEPDDPELVPIAYEAMSRLDGSLPEATYAFCELDRIDGDTMRSAVALARRVAEAGPGHRLANWPNRVMNQLEVLTTLMQRGINDFACWRFIEQRSPQRFPVFLRIDGMRNATVSPLLETAAALRSAITRVLAEGARREDILIVEFQETDRFEGDVVRYSLWNAFGRLFPAGLVVTRHWPTQQPSAPVRNERIEVLERDWLQRNPHADAAAMIFRHAAVDWGCIQYGVHQGRLQIFDIDTNPLGLSAEQAPLADVHAALGQLAAPPPGTGKGRSIRPEPVPA